MKTVLVFEKEAGLPEISGTVHMRNGVRGFGSGDGVFSVSNYGSYGMEGQGTNGYALLTFSASASNIIYGKSETVQPHSITCRMWQRES